jgi:hypothetical protein
MILIKDNTFSVDEIYKYTLCFKIADQAIEIGVFDASMNRYLVYESYSFDKDMIQLTFLEQLYKEHLFISAGYWKKIILLSTLPKYVYVPEEFFSTQNAVDLLRLNATIETDKLDVCYVPHQKQQMNCIFGIEKSLLKWIKGKYPYQEITYLHENSCLLEGLLTQPHSLEIRDLYIFMQANTITPVSFKQGYLQYLNTFAYAVAQDFVYYTLLVIEKLGLHRQEVNVIIYGDVPKSTALLNELGKYVSSIKLGKRPKGIVLGHKFDEIEEHIAFDMLSIPIVTK